MQSSDTRRASLVNRQTEKKRQFWKIELREFVHQLLFPLLCGALMLALVWFAYRSDNGSGAALSVSLLAALVTTLAIWAFIASWKHLECHKLTDAFVTEAVDDAAQRAAETITDMLSMLRTLQVYGSLADAHLSSTWRFADPFTSVLIRINDDRGGIVISGDREMYIKVLNIFCVLANKSFDAILRGGDTLLYRPRSFFAEDAEWYPEVYTYLKTIADSENLGGRVRRIMIFSEDTLRQDFADKRIRTQFLNVLLKNEQKLYWVDPKSLEQDQRLDQNKDTWNEDYAILDGEVVLKHSGQSVYISTGIIACFCKIFELLDGELDAGIPYLFTPVTEDCFGNKSWTDWLDGPTRAAGDVHARDSQ